ncbi:hypothetical protein DRO58_00735 [Candidatus Bathyarchaeota archaeon]|nr:MAG: hypothetical protein DRO58_00735 [Candidatus Bathyarchaeota archaeon]
MKTSLKQLRKDKAGVSTAVITLIVLVIGVALAIVAMAVAGGFITAWGGAARVTIERADILIDPSTGTAYITVDVRNSGGASLAPVTDGTTLTVNGPNGEVTVTWDPDPANIDPLNPGNSISFTGTAGGLQAGQTYVIQVTFRDPAGNMVSDQKSVLAHI